MTTPVTLSDHLTATAAERSDHTAIVWQDEQISYQELDRRVSKAAAGLQELGLQPGDRVAVMAGNTPHFVVALFAIVRAGGVVVPVNTALTPPEVKEILTDAGATVFVLAESEIDVLQPVRDGVDSLDHIVMAGARETIEGVSTTWSAVEQAAATGLRDVPQEPDDLAALVYTSGTTGRPNGAMLTHRNLAANQEQTLATRLRVESGDVVLAALPLFHIYALNVGIGVSLRAGATLVLVERFDPVGTLEVIAAHDVSVILGAPPMYVAWLNTPGIERADLSSVRIAVSGAAPLPPQVFSRFHDELGVVIWEGYGLTEASPVVTSNAVGDSPKPGSVGRPLPEVQVRLVDDDGREVTPGDPGEILVRGDNVFTGYWNDPESTRRALTEDGWLRTGDIAIVDDEGYVRIVDRKQDLILVSGFSVYPREIERVLHAHPKVVHAAAVGIPHPYTGETVKAFVVPAADGNLTEDEIVAWCGRRLASFKCPATVEFVEQLPQTATGKVRRTQLRERS